MRLIDLDYALQDMCRDADYASDYTDRWLEELPRVDAVPVIRCKDCKWYEYDEKLHCGLPHGIRMKDDYCSDAERKEE